MIKRLKIKFILINMCLISVVMTLAFSVLYYKSAHELETASKDALREIAYEPKDPLNNFFGENKFENKHSNFVTYTLDIDSRTNTCYIDGFGDAENLTDEKIEYVHSLINAVDRMNSNEGVLKEFNMRFYKTVSTYKTRIVLLDKQYEDQSLKQLLMSFAFSGAIAFLAFLIISVLLAYITVKPVEKSWKQQKRLISDVSHELKTPITIINTNTDIILSHKDSSVENETKWIGYIKDETERMSDLVNSMLYLAKSDEAETKPKLEAVDLSNLVYEVALPFESVCYEKHKAYTYDIAPDVRICGDNASLKQLLIILLDNAVKYSNENGNIRIELSIISDKATVSVFNTGVPIPKECIPYLFDRFFRVEKSRTRENGGSGLGLSIAKRIIEYNEGTISVTSSEENGTLFTCSFKHIKTKKKENKNHDPDFS